MRRIGILALIFHLSICSFGQILEVSPISLGAAFSIPKAETIESVSKVSSGSSMVLTTQSDNIFLRPLSVETGFPIRLLSIRSNETKKVRKHILRGDSLFCMIKSVEKNNSAIFESVIYTVHNDQLAEAERHQVGFTKPLGRKNAQPIFFEASENGKVSVVARQFPFVKEKKANLFVEITHYPTSNTTSHTIPLPFESDDIEITGITISNNGLVFIGAKTGIKLNSPFLRKHLLYSFNQDSLEPHEFDLSVDKLFIDRMAIKNMDNQIHVLALFSSDPFKQGQAAGFTFFKLNSQGAEVEEKFIHMFDSKTILDFNSEAKPGQGIEDLTIQAVLPNEENSWAIMDQRYLDQVCTTDPRTGIITCTDQYHFDGILLKSLPDSEKSHFIGRDQVDYNTAGDYMGQQTFVSDGKLIVLYNDHMKNTSIQADRIMNNPGRSILRYVYVNEENKLVSDVYQGLDDFVLLTKVPGYQINGKVVLLLSNGKDFKLGTIDTSRL